MELSSDRKSPVAVLTSGSSRTNHCLQSTGQARSPRGKNQRAAIAERLLEFARAPGRAGRACAGKCFRGKSQTAVCVPFSVAERGLLARKPRHLLLDGVEKQVNRYH